MKIIQNIVFDCLLVYYNNTMAAAFGERENYLDMARMLKIGVRILLSVLMIRFLVY